MTEFEIRFFGTDGRLSTLQGVFPQQPSAEEAHAFLVSQRISFREVVDITPVQVFEPQPAAPQGPAPLPAPHAAVSSGGWWARLSVPARALIIGLGALLVIGATVGIVFVAVGTGTGTSNTNTRASSSSSSASPQQRTTIEDWATEVCEPGHFWDGKPGMFLQQPEFVASCLAKGGYGTVEFGTYTSKYLADNDADYLRKYNYPLARITLDNGHYAVVTSTHPEMTQALTKFGFSTN